MASPTMTQAVQEAWLAAQAVAANGLPSLTMDEVAEDQPQLPTAVYKHLGERPQYSTGNDTPEYVEGLFQIQLTQVQLAACETLALAVMTVYKPSSLSFSGGQTSTLMRKNYKLELIGRDANGNEVYQGTLDYRCLIGAPTA